MACDEKYVSIYWAEALYPYDPSCGCYRWGHVRDGKECIHEEKCAAHKLIELLEKKE
jgi:hypothetical protein